MFADLLTRLRPIRRMPIWLRYAATAAIVMVCFGLRWLLQDVDESAHLPLFLMFVPAVIVSSFLFDRGSGFFAVALSSVIGIYFFVEPAGSFGLHHVGEVVRLVTFIAIGLLTASVIEALRKAVDELSQRTEELSRTRSELLSSNEQRALLLSDINHRIKNHLATVSAALALDRRQTEDRKAKDAFESAISRLTVLGRVYTRLHVSGPEVALDAGEFLEGLCSDLTASLVGLRPVSLDCSVDAVKIDAQQAVTLGLIVNELVANAIKYAFPGDRPGQIRVTFRQRHSGYELEVLDDGEGIGPDRVGTGAGTKLVHALVAQMRGSVEWHREGGTQVQIRIPAARGHEVGPTDAAAIRGEA
jgi:two-component sensor histidine kinase